MSERRRRIYTLDDAQRWARAVADGLDGSAFQARFGISLKQARDRARDHGVEVPRIDQGRMRDAKAPPTEERSVLWFPTPRSRRKAGATRRRMT